MNATAGNEPVILDWVLPRFDATVAVHRIVDGDPDAVYGALMAIDLAEIPRSNPAVRALFAIRTAAERVLCALRGRPALEPDPGAQLRLADLEEHGEWVRLAEDAPREFAFGAIGRFWAGETVWETIDAAEFAAFDQPGFAKIVCSISLRPYGSERTLVSYEARTQALDPASRTAFLRYWRFVRPGVAIVMGGFLRAVATAGAARLAALRDARVPADG